jgi:hypothetical protein
MVYHIQVPTKIKYSWHEKVRTGGWREGEWHCEVAGLRQVEPIWPSVKIDDYAGFV